MNLFRDPMDVAFHLIPPEVLMECIENGCAEDGEVNVKRIAPDLFDRHSRSVMPTLTPDEMELIHQLTGQNMHSAQQEVLRQRGMGDTSPSVFHLLTNFTKDLLQTFRDEPIYDIGGALRWRSISFRLGQDLLTTSHLAWNDLIAQKGRTYFAWPLVIQSNDRNMISLMDNGSAENHFHLEGSVPVFHLSWVCLMNHPNDCFRMEKSLDRASRLFRYNLHPGTVYSSRDHQISWSERLQMAAWLRAKLFQRLQGQDVNGITVNKFKQFEYGLGSQNQELCKLVAELRKDWGRNELVYNKQNWCLDYANCLSDQRNEGFHKLLVGERYFLYHCFTQCFLGKHGKFGFVEQNLFYLYLLLKSCFRSELVQVNRRAGFRNFYAYQNRKSLFWDKYPEYRTEAYRMAINNTILEGKLHSLEARIMTQRSASQLSDYIYDVDRVWLEARHSREWRREGESRPDSLVIMENKPLAPQSIRCIMEYEHTEADRQNTKNRDRAEFFYVLHFPKYPLPLVSEEIQDPLLPMRHDRLRREIKEMAIATATALQADPYLRTRIRGIDGCSTEIGCRPENFATEFRFLKHYDVEEQELRWFNLKSRQKPILGMTFHAGEDFISVEDGLRAIDEAVSFLNLTRGCRIGHALALGVDPEAHYHWKGDHLPERKQDRLDNLVWMLFRADELSVHIPSDLRVKMERRAEALMRYIYESVKEVHSLHDYYEAWKLRGDHPDQIKRYYIGQDDSPGLLSSVMEQYQISMENHFFQPVGMAERSLSNRAQIEIAYAYLFHSQVRIRGQEIDVVKMDSQYLNLVREMQNKMMQYLNNCGIGVECNPSSNVLIGSFDRYDEHPLFRFNDDALAGDHSTGNQMCISINTDDQGVFDTSLENEYALLASCLYRKTNDRGEKQYSQQTVLRYLRHLQEMGKQQIFPGTE